MSPWSSIWRDDAQLTRPFGPKCPRFCFRKTPVLITTSSGDAVRWPACIFVCDDAARSFLTPLLHDHPPAMSSPPSPVQSTAGSRQTRSIRLSSTSPLPITRSLRQPTTPMSLFTNSPPQSGPRDYFGPQEQTGWTVFGQLLEDDRTPGARGHDTPVHSIRRGRSRAVSRQLLPAVSASPDVARSTSPIPQPEFVSSPPRNIVSPPTHAHELPRPGAPRRMSAADSHFSAFTQTESVAPGEEPTSSA